MGGESKVPVESQVSLEGLSRDAFLGEPAATFQDTFLGEPAAIFTMPWLSAKRSPFF